MVKKAKTKKEKTVEIKTNPLELQVFKVKIIGKTPLLMDKFSDAVKQQILDKQSKGIKAGKKMLRDVDNEVKEAIHRTSSGKVGFPFYGFKKAMMETTSFIGDKFFSKKLVSGAVQIVNVVDGLIPIKYKKQDILEHFINPNTKFTPQFHDWSCELEISFDPNNISAQDIVNVLNYAGHYIGLGAWRPKGSDGGSGVYGMYYAEV